MFLSLFLTACGAQPATLVSAQQPLSTQIPDSTAVAADSLEGEDSPYATYYLVVADTGANYYLLQQKMLRLSTTYNIPIDTLGRYYNAGKDLIALPDEDEDEMYAGSYYPRRETSEYLSLEYLNYYQETAPEKTIALVRGIYGSETDAQEKLAALKPNVPTAFKMQARIYMGCMH